MSTRSNRIEFPARFYYVLNEATGEEFVLPTNEAIEEEITMQRNDFEESMEASKELGEGDSSRDKRLRLFDAEVTAYRARRRKERDTAKAAATEMFFTLVKPDYGQLIRIQSEANQLDLTTGGTRWDESRYRYLLMANDGVKKDGRVLSVEEIEALGPCIGQHLGALLARSVATNQKRMVFTAPGSDPT